jgi:hypothetical protein
MTRQTNNYMLGMGDWVALFLRRVLVEDKSNFTYPLGGYQDGVQLRADIGTAIRMFRQQRPC